MRRSCFALVLCACGATTPSPEPTTEGPELPSAEGLALYPVPSEEAPPEMRELLDALAGVLAHRLAPPSDESLEGVRAWTDATFTTYLREHLQRVRALEERATPLAERDDADAVVAAIVVAVAYDDFRRALDEIPLPEEIRGDEELAAIFRDAIAGASYPLARRAADAYGWCNQRSERLPEALRGWAARCSERAAALGAIEPPPERPRTRAAPVIAWPSECASEETYTREPDAPPPDLRRPEAIAIVGDAGEMEADDRARLLDAVRTRVDELVVAPVIPTREVLEAERLRAERRVRRRGPVCGQPPPLAWVLADRHPNLVIGQIHMDCFQDDHREVCSLRVGFRRAGTEADEGLPAVLAAQMVGDPSEIETWLSAASRLAPEPPYGGLVGVWQGPSSIDVRVRDDADEDPWLRLRSLLRERSDALSACLPEGVASFSASFDVSAVGDPSAIVVEPRTGGSVEAAACVRRVLEEARWPCAPEARPRRVEITLCLARRPEG